MYNPTRLSKDSLPSYPHKLFTGPQVLSLIRQRSASIVAFELENKELIQQPSTASTNTNSNSNLEEDWNDSASPSDDEQQSESSQANSASDSHDNELEEGNNALDDDSDEDETSDIDYQQPVAAVNNFTANSKNNENNNINKTNLPTTNSSSAKPAPRAVLLCPSKYSVRPSTLYFPYPVSFPQQRAEKSIGSQQSKELLPKFIIADGATRYNAVIGTLKRAGFTEVEADSSNFHVRWGKHMKVEQLKKLKSWQKINHFVGTYNLGRKDCLARQIGRMRRFWPAEYNFLPETLCLPNDWALLQSKFHNNSHNSNNNHHNTNDHGEEIVNPSNLWIMKPIASSCGRGIHVVSSLSSVSSKKAAVISRYIERPLLINSKKFDLRVYILVSSYNPLIIYRFSNGLVRFCTENYSHKGLNNRFRHLTNYAINKNNKKFVKNQGNGTEKGQESQNSENSEEFSSSKWSFHTLRAYFVQQGLNFAEIERQIDEIAIKTLLSIETHTSSQLLRLNLEKNCFELFGFDILIDCQLKCWLMEVNVSPSLSSSSGFDREIKNSVVTDALHLIGIKPIYSKKPREQENCKEISETKQIRTQKSQKGKNPTKKAEQRAKLGAAAMNSRLYALKNASSLSNFPLTPVDLALLRDYDSEITRKGQFLPIYPHNSYFLSMEKLFEQEKFNNLLLRRFLQLSCAEKSLLLAVKSRRQAKIPKKIGEIQGNQANSRVRPITAGPVKNFGEKLSRGGVKSARIKAPSTARGQNSQGISLNTSALLIKSFNQAKIA
jgi:hypothetical protein